MFPHIVGSFPFGLTPVISDKNPGSYSSTIGKGTSHIFLTPLGAADDGKLSCPVLKPIGLVNLYSKEIHLTPTFTNSSLSTFFSTLHQDPLGTGMVKEFKSAPSVLARYLFMTSVPDINSNTCPTQDTLVINQSCFH